MKNKKNNQNKQQPVLRFSPTAWAKLLYMRDVTDNEVGGFGITEADDLLFVTDFILVKQKVTSVSVAFDDESVADLFDDQVAVGRKPEQFARIWLHSHPGDSPHPSVTDENTFARVFGNCNWALMFIVAANGKTYARLRFNVGPGAEVNVPVYVDYDSEFDAADFKAWKKEYKANVTEEKILNLGSSKKKNGSQEKDEIEIFGGQEYQTEMFAPEDMIEELEMMHPAQRQLFMDELAVRSDFWDEESEVLYD